MRSPRLATLALVLLPAMSHAQATVTPASFTGRWTGEGIILGQPSTVEMEWAPVLDGTFAKLTWVSRIGPAPKTRRFEGHAYYRAGADGRVRATWFDSSGQVRPIEATAEATALVAAWGTPETEVGETTYRLAGADRVEVVDRVRAKDGSWREFGRSQLTRVR